MEQFDDFEYEIDCDEIWKEHLNLKRKKVNRLKIRRSKTKRLCRQLTSSGNWKASVRLDSDWNPKTQEYEYNGRIKRAKRSHYQKWMKHYSNRIVRRHPENTLSKKGKDYKKQYDFWGRWY